MSTTAKTIIITSIFVASIAMAPVLLAAPQKDQVKHPASTSQGTQSKMKQGKKGMSGMMSKSKMKQGKKGMSGMMSKSKMKQGKKGMSGMMGKGKMMKKMAKMRKMMTRMQKQMTKYHHRKAKGAMANQPGKVKHLK